MADSKEVSVVSRRKSASANKTPWTGGEMENLISQWSEKICLGVYLRSGRAFCSYPVILSTDAKSWSLKRQRVRGGMFSLMLIRLLLWFVLFTNKLFVNIVISIVYFLGKSHSHVKTQVLSHSILQVWNGQDNASKNWKQMSWFATVCNYAYPIF